MGRTGKYSSHKDKQSKQYDLKVKTTNKQKRQKKKKKSKSIKYRDLYEKKMFCLHADFGLGYSLRPQWDILFLSWNISSYKFVTGFLCMASYILMSQHTRFLYHSTASVRILSKFQNF